MYGVASLLSLAQLMLAFYLTCIISSVRARLFRLAGGIHIFKYPLYQGELLIVLGTSSSNPCCRA